MAARRPQVVILCATSRRAREWREARGLPSWAVLWPRSLADLAGRESVRLVVLDPTAWAHPRAEELIEWAHRKYERDRTSRIVAKRKATLAARIAASRGGGNASKPLN